MTRNWLTTTAAASLALALMAGPAAAQAYGDWDANSDAMIDQTEWNTGWANQGLTGSIDADGDGSITRTEFEEAIGDEARFTERYGETAYEDWDSNDDDVLNDEELSAGMYSAYDADDSGGIDETEFGAYEDDVGEEGLFDI
ncbi:MAG: hypothetical protein ACFE0R_17420 [Salinarimonas sp.]